MRQQTSLRRSIHQTIINRRKQGAGSEVKSGAPLQNINIL
jgi:hypothetical protein